MKVLVALILIAVGLLPIAASATPPTPSPASPMVKEIQEVVDASRQAVAQLTTERAQTTDPVRIQAIDAEASKIKQEVRLEIFRIQLRHYRAAGNYKAVAKLEAVIEKITAPAPKGQPQPRPTPDQLRRR